MTASACFTLAEGLRETLTARVDPREEQPVLEIVMLLESMIKFEARSVLERKGVQINKRN